MQKTSLYTFPILVNIYYLLWAVIVITAQRLDDQVTKGHLLLYENQYF